MNELPDSSNTSWLDGILGEAFGDKPSTATDRPAALPGQVGHFQVVRLLGSGGMGSVYEATQEHPQRRVALKVLRIDASDPEGRKRFAREANLLGQLSHPNIAQIYEAGSFQEDGVERPYFAMEFIAGAATLTDFAQREELDLRAKLELFLEVLEGVEAGHRHGVVHRDLKPDNILVSGSAEKPQVKVIDFGVARVNGGDQPAESLQTQMGQIIGTLHYMSPEQIQADPNNIDERADVYSLGVVLFELISGHLPYDLTGQPILEQIRIIQQGVPERLSTTSRGLRGDLDTITAKALEKDRARRYRSAEALATDLRAYLEGRTISARPASAAYRLRKFTQRNKGVVVSLMALFVVLVAATAISLRWATIATANAKLAKDAEKAANERTRELEQVAEFQARQLADLDVERMGLRLRRQLLDSAPVARREALEVAVSESNFSTVALSVLRESIFDRTLEAIDDQFEEQPIVRAGLLQTASTTLRELGLVEHAGEPQARVVALRREHLGEEHEDTLASLAEMCALEYASGRLPGAIQAGREAVVGFQGTLGVDHRKTLDAMATLAIALRSQGEFAEAESLVTEALARAERTLGEDHIATLQLVSEYAFLKKEQRKLEDSLEWERRAVAGCRRSLDPDHPYMLTCLNNLGVSYLNLSRLAEAEPLLAEAHQGFLRLHGEDHPRTLQLAFNLGQLKVMQGKLEESEAPLQTALAGQRQVLGNLHPSTLATIHLIGVVHQMSGRLAEAEPYYREALDGQRIVLGEEHPDTLVTTHIMGDLYRLQGKLDLSRQHFLRALEAQRRILGDLHPDTQRSINATLQVLGISVAAARSQSANVEVGVHLTELGALQRSTGRVPQAIASLSEALDLLLLELPEAEDPRRWRAQIELGQAHVQQRAFVDAESYLLEAAEFWDERVEEQPPPSAVHAFEAITALYEAWHGAEPESGYGREAERWKERLP